MFANVEQVLQFGHVSQLCRFGHHLPACGRLGTTVWSSNNPNSLQKRTLTGVYDGSYLRMRKSHRESYQVVCGCGESQNSIKA
jgi:hypothetical protein